MTEIIDKIYTPASVEEIKQYMRENFCSMHQAKTKLNNIRYFEAKKALKEKVALSVTAIVLDIELNGDENLLEHVKTLALLVNDLSKAV